MIIFQAPKTKKGIDSYKALMREVPYGSDSAMTAYEIAAIAYLSPDSARRYLNYAVQEGVIASRPHKRGQRYYQPL